MDFGIFWLKWRERRWIAENGEIPDGYCLSFGILGAFKPRLYNCKTGERVPEKVAE